jgi:ferrochelatase
VLSPFYKQKSFYRNQARISAQIKREPNTKVLFSFHGLPEKQILKNKNCALNANCCDNPKSLEGNCYRAQCLDTAKKLAQEMNLQAGEWQVSFQSRLGRARWLGPSTDSALVDLAKSGVSNVLVVCPSFVADCLETLEEIGIGEKQRFLASGGKSFELSPCLNSDKEWVREFAEYLRTQMHFP